LVLALDRLTLGLVTKTTTSRLDPPVNQLFKDAQSLPDFNPAPIAADLDKFQQTLARHCRRGRHAGWI